VDVIDPQTGEVRQAQIFVAVLGASSLTFAMASFGQRLPDWIEGQTRALAYIGGVPKAIVCDNLNGRGQGVVVRADAQSNLCRHGGALRHDDFADPQPQAAGRGQG
jgi:transposase